MGETVMFLHPWMLMSLGLCSVPVILHLLLRRKADAVSWGAMYFLLHAQRQVRVRTQLRTWIQLCVQTLTLLCFILACAVPMFFKMGENYPPHGKGWSFFSFFTAEKGIHSIFILDNTPSMNALMDLNSTLTRFQLAQRRAEYLIRSAADADRFTIMVTSPEDSERLFTRSLVPLTREDALNTLVNLKCNEQLFSQSHHWIEELETLREKSTLPTQVCVFTDFQREAWNTISSFPDGITWYDLGIPCNFKESSDILPANLALERIIPSQLPCVVHEPANFKVSVHNHSAHHVQGVSVELCEFDGNAPKPISQKWISIPAHGKADLDFTCRFTRTGSQKVLFRIISDTPDYLLTDNQATLTLMVRDHLRALIVESATGRDGNSSRYLTAGIQGLRSVLTADGIQRTAQADVISDGALENKDLSVYDVIYFIDIPRFTTVEAQHIHHYLENGGGVVFFLGKHVQPDSYAVLGAFLPGLPTERQHVSENNYLNPLNNSHEILRVFRGHENSGLKNVPVMRKWLTDLTPGAVSVAEIDKTAAILTRTLKQGRVMEFTFSLDESDTPLPFMGAFIPLMDSMLTYLSSGMCVESVLPPQESSLSRLDPKYAVGHQKIETLTGSDIYQVQKSVHGSPHSAAPLFLFSGLALLLVDMILFFRTRSLPQVVHISGEQGA